MLKSRFFYVLIGLSQARDVSPPNATLLHVWNSYVFLAHTQNNFSGNWFRASK